VSLATTLTLRCDEIPLLVRFTGLCGRATTEHEALRFTPTLYSFRTGAMRSLQVPPYTFAVHTSTGFWTNLTIHLFGMSPGAARVGPLIFSTLAIVLVALAVWLAGGRIPGACVAGMVMALSPSLIAYGAQARGYAEAMALTPLMLIALEKIRRRPDDWRWATCGLLSTLAASLTVYTVWVFWVFPVLVVAWFLLPRITFDDQARRIARTVMTVIVVAVAAFMAVYTAARWKQLTAIVGYGVRFDGPDAVLDYLVRVARELLPIPLVVGLLALVGVAAIRRSPAAWWRWLIVAAAITPILFAAVNGSAGYVRNLTYLIGPIAMLAGVGADALLRRAEGRTPRWIVGGLSASVLAIGALYIAGASRSLASGILLPDWGQVVQSLEKDPLTVGPRWMCPCLANHWQINWYRTRVDENASSGVPPDSRIEIVLGAQLGDDGRPKVFRHDPVRGDIRESSLPPYLVAVARHDLIGGVELRRCVATETSLESLADVAAENPVFIEVIARTAIANDAWMRFLTVGQADVSGVVTFKEQPTPIGIAYSMIAPVGALDKIVPSLRDDLGFEDQDIRFFSLAPLPYASH
jgi:hypothetical protein